MKNAIQYDVGIVGTGPAGLAAALILTRLGLRTAIIGPSAKRPDNRTAALFTGSIQLLTNLGAWEACRSAAEPLKAIRIIDDTGGLLRAPEVVFTAAEVGLETFGYNVPNATLTRALHETATSQDDALTVVETAGVEDLEIEAEQVRLHLAGGGTICVRLVIGADGRN